MRFKVTYRCVVTTIRVDGEYEIEVEAGTPEQARACVLHGGSRRNGAFTVGKAAKIVETLGCDSSNTAYDVRRVEEVK